jgi:hypothetical protein
MTADEAALRAALFAAIEKIVRPAIDAAYARGVPQWQPIGEEPIEGQAPWDGMSILVSNGASVGEAHFEIDDGRFFWANTHSSDYVDGAVWDATHWQPLPAPPHALIPAGDKPT